MQTKQGEKVQVGHVVGLLIGAPLAGEPLGFVYLRTAAHVVDAAADFVTVDFHTGKWPGGFSRVALTGQHFDADIRGPHVARLLGRTGTSPKPPREAGLRAAWDGFRRIEAARYEYFGWKGTGKEVRYPCRCWNCEAVIEAPTGHEDDGTGYPVCVACAYPPTRKDAPADANQSPRHEGQR